jgi:hypothetical protein
MQVVKILLKLVKDVESGKTKDWVNTDARYLLGAVEAMLNGEKGGSCPAESKDAMMDVNVIRDAYQHRAARLLVSVSRQIQNDVMEGKTFEDAWNGALIQMGRVSRAHSAYLLFDNFVTNIQEESGKKLIGRNEVSALMDLALLIGLCGIEKEVGDFLEDGYLNAGQVAWASAHVCRGRLAQHQRAHGPDLQRPARGALGGIYTDMVLMGTSTVLVSHRKGRLRRSEFFFFHLDRSGFVHVLKPQPEVVGWWHATFRWKSHIWRRVSWAASWRSQTICAR